MADGKWISGLKATTPVAEAARRVLQVRLGVVGKRLPRALLESDKDPEHVHQLRVGTRRAGAALKIFESALKGKAWKRARKVLRRLRRAAGEARDWDVFLNDLAARLGKAKPAERPGLDFLAGYAFGQRRTAQQHLLEVGESRLDHFDRVISRTLKGIRRRGNKPVLLDLARPLLSGLLEELHKAAQADLTQYENLHQVRIAGKGLRYAMEVFASGFGRAFREQYYPAVERLQEILGDANDSHVAAQRLSALANHLQASRPELWRRCRAGIGRLLDEHQRRVTQQRTLFLEWWREWQRAELVLKNLLKR